MGDFFGLGPSEFLLIGVIAILLFGKNLPEMSRKVGKYLGDFRKSVQHIQSEIHSVTSEIETDKKTTASNSSNYSSDQEEATAPKFEPPST
jgi:sec-independent protein translocase protein TatA